MCRDYPNAWAPLVDMIIEGLDATDTQEGKALAKDIAKKWLRTNFAAFTKIGKMIEKYDAEGCGLIGGGGEYSPQVQIGYLFISNSIWLFGGNMSRHQLLVFYFYLFSLSQILTEDSCD